ncbi:MAG: formyltransferase family protein [Patescibacteria group bacterium]|nr:formyltransferase family protein [bacterium]MDZ4240877.1 formyltransferase family protein [Patescibacteria group bacterium]
MDTKNMNLERGTMDKPRLLIFASGSKDGSGGSGFENLVHNARENKLFADIIGVVSSRENGGVRARAERLKIPFTYFSGPWVEEEYKKIVDDLKPDFIALSGWLKHVKGLPPEKTFNIHPGPLPRFGGKGMYGYYVHEAVIEAFHKGEIDHTQLCMHFVTPDEYDRGPVFFRLSIPIKENDTAESLQYKVSDYEHAMQPFITDLVVRGEIRWDGKNPRSLHVPHGFSIYQYM